MRRLLVFCLAFGGYGLVGCTQHSASPSTPVQASIAAGEVVSRLPEFSVKDLQGRQVTSEELRGKVVLIDFWATWCEPCKREMPGYQQIGIHFLEKRGGICRGHVAAPHEGMDSALVF